MIVPGIMRRARLQALMARELLNWQDAWRAYSTGSAMPLLRFRNGLVFHSGPRDAGYLFFEIFANGCYRRGFPSALRGEVVDIGANIGAFTLDVARRYPEITLHAYEPDPETCEGLRRNIEANALTSRVQIWNEAVAETAGTLRLWRGDGSSVVASAHLPAAQRGESVDVAAVTLETVVARASGRVRVLKMDCEGAEAEILEGAGRALDSVDFVVAEYHIDLVPDVIPRITRALEPAFAVTVADGQRCGPMIRARRVGVGGAA